MRIFLISGAKRSGKDFIGEELERQLEQIGQPSVILKFADPVKEIIATSFGLTLEELDYLKNDESQKIQVLGNDLTMRSVLQHFATEAMQGTFGKTVWRDLLIKKIKSLKNINNIIITDFRFLHEGFDLPGCQKITIRVLGGEPDDHQSEHDLDGFEFDYRVDNQVKDSNKAKTAVQKIISKIFKK